MSTLTLAPAATTALPAGAPIAQTCSLLRMAVADDVLAIPIDDVREILQVGRLTPLPRTPDFVRGVMNLRGAVVPVIDLAARLGGAATVIGRRSCIVVVEHTPAHADDGRDDHADPAVLVIGLLVDAVYEVFDCGLADIETAPALGTRIAADALLGMTRAHGAVIGVLGLARVLAPDDLARAIDAFQPH